MTFAATCTSQPAARPGGSPGVGIGLPPGHQDPLGLPELCTSVGSGAWSLAAAKGLRPLLEAPPPNFALRGAGDLEAPAPKPT